MSDRPTTVRPLALVTGAAGLIGHALVADASRWAPDWEVWGVTRDDIDLTQIDQVRAFWHNRRPQLVIHCAGLTRPANCERDPALARRLNVEVTAYLAEFAREIPFVFFSTDLVFDGKKGHYVETDPVNPLNMYAETKAAAERVVLANPKHTVIRPSLTAGRSPTRDRSFVEETRQAWEAGRTLTLFTDEVRCPISLSATTRAVWELVQKGQAGLYHLAGAEAFSRWEIGQLLARHWPKLDAKMVPGSLCDYAGPACPPDLSFNCKKIQSVLSFPLPSFRDWLADGVATGEP
jgi:dTDP-4-dehydrorhamnose reductase